MPSFEEYDSRAERNETVDLTLKSFVVTYA
jgi:hypothetical protein